MHERLLQKGRGAEKQPGEFRRSQNWLGGTRLGNAHFVPAPPDAVPDAMSALEAFLHDEAAGYPVLVVAAMAHVQFETIQFLSSRLIAVTPTSRSTKSYHQPTP
jgi:Fic family protein